MATNSISGVIIPPAGVVELGERRAYRGAAGQRGRGAARQQGRCHPGRECERGSRVSQAAPSLTRAS